MGWNHGLGAWIGATVAGIVGLAAFMAYMAVASGQSVYETMDTNLRGYGQIANTCIASSAPVACDALASALNTGPISVASMQALVLDVDFVDANASAAYLQVSCQSKGSYAGAIWRDLPVIVATDANGISYLEKDIRRWYGLGNTAPGTSSFTVTFANLPAPWIRCQFTCGAGAQHIDTVTACPRGKTP